MKLEPLKPGVPLIEDVPYYESMQAAAVKLRWVNAQCYEIKLPNGKTIITDPFYISPSDGKMKMPVKITADDFEGCDYIVLNHSHRDHALNVPDLYKKYEPQIICDSRYAFELSKAFDIPFGNIYPVDPGNSYVFPDFRLEVTQTLHNPRLGDTANSRIREKDLTERLFGIPGTGDLELTGSLFDLNYMFILPSRFKIGFAAGVDLLNMQESWRVHGPDILLRQRGKKSAEEFASEIEGLGGMLALPMHHESAQPHNANMHEFIDEVNAVLASRGSAQRALNPKRMQWYTVSLGISMS